jgi:hypothetical protein
MNVSNLNVDIISGGGVPGCRNVEVLSVNELNKMLLQLYATGTGRSVSGVVCETVQSLLPICCHRQRECRRSCCHLLSDRQVIFALDR